MESLLDLVWWDEDEDVQQAYGNPLVNSVCLVLCNTVAMSRCSDIALIAGPSNRTAYCGC